MNRINLTVKLKQFEQRYHMNTEDFQHQFNGGKLGDNQDYFEWDAVADMANRLKEKLAVVHEAVDVFQVIEIIEKDFAEQST